MISCISLSVKSRAHAFTPIETYFRYILYTSEYPYHTNQNIIMKQKINWYSLADEIKYLYLKYYSQSKFFMHTSLSKQLTILY